MRPSLVALTSLTLLFGGPAQAQKELNSAREALAEELPNIAALRIQAFLEKNPKLSKKEKQQANLLLGESLLRSGQSAQALLVLKKVSTTAGSPRSYWLGLAQAHEGNFPAALTEFARVKTESPLYPQALFNRLELQYLTSDYPAALETLALLRTTAPDYRSAELTRLEARLHLAQEAPEQSLKALEALSPAEFKKPTSQLLVGRAHQAAGEQDKALKTFQAISTQDSPPSFSHLVTLGKIDALLAGEEFEEALTLLLSLLSEETSTPFLDTVDLRLRKLLSAANPNLLTGQLSTFVSPKTLGEDSNYPSPQKNLAAYYLCRTYPHETARPLRERLLSLEPEPELTARIHLDLAKHALEVDNRETAQQHLNATNQAAPYSPLAAQAADILARLAVDEEQNTEAIKLFTEAARHPNASFAETALLNQAILELANNPTQKLSALHAKLLSPSSQIDLELEKTLAKARNQDPQTIDLLQEFIARHPLHPRLAEVRLTLIDALLLVSQPNFESIENQLASLPQNLSESNSKKAFKLRHRLSTITAQWADTVAAGKGHRKNFPSTERDPYFLLSLAECYFRNGELGPAHVLFAKIAEMPNAGDLTEIALYYSARSNLQIPTPEAIQEAHNTFDLLISQAGPLATAARLLKARTLLRSQGKPRQCLQTLEGIPGNPSDQPEAALLTAEAYRELASEEPELLNRAVRIYQRLIADPRTDYPLSNQLHYQLALTYRKNNQPDLALEPCLTVVNGGNRKVNEEEVEWDYYYRCGFEAIDILLESKRPRAAFIQARKLANTQGPGAEQAKERAEQIQLDNLLLVE